MMNYYNQGTTLHCLHDTTIVYYKFALWFVVSYAYRLISPVTYTNDDL